MPPGDTPEQSHCQIQEAAHMKCDKHRKTEGLQENVCIVALVGILVGVRHNMLTRGAPRNGRAMVGGAGKRQA